MARFIFQRLFGMVVKMFFVSIMVFALMGLPLGDYAERYAFRKMTGAGTTMTESDLANIHAKLGLDRPAPEIYID